MEHTISLLTEKDAVFASIIEKYGTPDFITRPEGFESMCCTILEQQVSLDSARACFNKLKSITENEIFSPEAILLLTDEQFRTCGVSRQKTIYLRALAEAVVNGAIDFGAFRTMHPDEVRRELIKLKGIGNWTIDVYLMFSLRSPDILPLGDIGIISAIKDLWGFSTMDEIVKHTLNWAPYRTTASFFLWHYYLKKRNRVFPHSHM